MAKNNEKSISIVRIGGVDLKGNEKIGIGLSKIYGVSYVFANAILKVLNIDFFEEVGNLTKEKRDSIIDVINNPEKYGIPSYLLNHRKNKITGKDEHLISSDLDLRIQFDIKDMQKLKSYRGVRHSNHLPLRGQRTKAGYTRPPYRKSRRGTVMGVRKKKKK